MGDKRRSRKSGRENMENPPEGLLMLIYDLLFTIYDCRVALCEAAFLNHNS
jgi:hypothetical protein